jgi:hypothetical protein
MSIYATVYDTQDAPISATFAIRDDDFSEAERLAAASGTKCCIRWYRDEDGQGAYWGPKGTTFRPYWYNSGLGRPAEMQGGKRRNVYLDDASWTAAVKLGNGNASDGIRIALAR